ncbi:hypothetical protein LF95_03335 [Thalassospira sp. TSL5-1]|nr:hypothetical protein LF95_03335 [Thalassospira sp. TSL5-1]
MPGTDVLYTHPPVGGQSADQDTASPAIPTTKVPVKTGPAKVSDSNFQNTDKNLFSTVASPHGNPYSPPNVR